MADRIRPRAIRREGELFKLIDSAQGKQERRADGTIMPGTVPNGRKAAAEAAGISLRQLKTYIRVANLGTNEFEAAVESDNPLVRSGEILRGYRHVHIPTGKAQE